MNISLARNLRHNMTQAELRFWQIVRDKRFMGLKFRRQYPVGPYIVDFICLGKNLIIELDGGQHNEQIEYDAQRTVYLQKLGFRVLRFWNNEFFLQTEDVLEQIYLAVKV
jgi:very-short-patch-repair endonuclease